jgi:hypothetical protein
MKVVLSLFAVACLSLALCVLPVNASIIGLYCPDTGDTLSVLMKDGRPFLRIRMPNFQDLPQCQGFQLYRHTPFQNTELELVEGDSGRGTGFGLWESEECQDAYLEAVKGGETIPARDLTQEIDVYNEFFAHFTNREDLIRGFEAGDFLLAVMYQADSNGFETTRQEVLYTYQDAVNGKVLLGPGSAPGQ